VHTAASTTAAPSDEVLVLARKLIVIPLDRLEALLGRNAEIREPARPTGERRQRIERF
jgi:hypothetical protein